MTRSRSHLGSSARARVRHFDIVRFFIRRHRRSVVASYLAHIRTGKRCSMVHPRYVDFPGVLRTPARAEEATDHPPSSGNIRRDSASLRKRGPSAGTVDGQWAWSRSRCGAAHPGHAVVGHRTTTTWVGTEHLAQRRAAARSAGRTARGRARAWRFKERVPDVIHHVRHSCNPYRMRRWAPLPAANARASRHRARSCEWRRPSRASATPSIHDHTCR
jgi:hypothetical protein